LYLLIAFSVVVVTNASAKKGSKSFALVFAKDGVDSAISTD
jgi:hypothetical protein